MPVAPQWQSASNSSRSGGAQVLMAEASATPPSGSIELSLRLSTANLEKRPVASDRASALTAILDAAPVRLSASESTVKREGTPLARAVVESSTTPVTPRLQTPRSTTSSARMWCKAPAIALPPEWPRLHPLRERVRRDAALDGCRGVRSPDHALSACTRSNKADSAAEPPVEEAPQPMPPHNTLRSRCNAEEVWSATFLGAKKFLT